MPRWTSRIRTLFRELMRRRVIQVLTMYLLLTKLVLEGADLLAGIFQLPDWTVSFAFSLMLLGLPVALFLSWVFDITPGGIRRTDAATPPEPSAPAATAVLSAPAPRAAGPAAVGAPREIRSLAVLPLANLSPDPENEYFSDGMTDELIAAFMEIGGLHVAARTSSFAFKGKQEDIRDIGEKLGVQAILEGSVRKSGNQLRIAMQLIDVTDGLHVWAETYRREMADVFAVQEEISRAVADVLRIRLAGSSDVPLVRTRTISVEAYNLYLKGRYHWNQRTEEGFRKAIGFFEEAIRDDAEYALAHAGLADAYAMLADYGLMAPAEALPRLQSAAERALQLDPHLAEAHTSLALGHQLAWRWQDAERDFARALALNPNYSIARHRRALLLAWLGREQDALDEILCAQRLDPLSLVINGSVGWIHYYARRYTRAAEQLARTLELNPSFANARVALGLVHLQQEQYEEAIAEIQRAMNLAGGGATNLALLVHVYGAAGRGREAKHTLALLREQCRHGYVSPYYLAVAHAGIGDMEQAMDNLETAFQDRVTQLVYLKVDPQLDALRTQPRFAHLLARLGLDEARPLVDAGTAATLPTPA